MAGCRVLLRAVACLGGLIGCVTVGVPAPGAHADSVSACPAALGRTAPWNAVCYRSHVPAQLLHSAPFPVIDPRAAVGSITGLPLSGIYVARLGSDFDPSLRRLHGPLMMIDFVFGAPLAVQGTGRANGTSLSVWEDGYQLSGVSGSNTVGGWHVDGLSFPEHLLEMQLTTDGPSRWLTALSAALSHAVQAQPTRVPPPPRLYVQAPGTHIRAGQAITFVVLSNTQVARKPAAFDLVLKGGWNRPRVIAAYEGSACGGDRAPGAVRRTPTLWTLNFGDCTAVKIELTPTRTGAHSVRIKTYELGSASGSGTRRLVPNGGFMWTGRVGYAPNQFSGSLRPMSRGRT